MPIGTQTRYTCNDPVEARLRDKFHQTKGKPGHAQAEFELSSYLWKRTEREIAEDRRKHPKARRNQGKPDGLETGAGRALP